MLMPLLASAVFCSPPRWIHELPPENIQNRKEMDNLNGVWERTVASPYSITDTRSRITAKEIIEINNSAYTKTHLYAEIVHDVKKYEIYIEKGRIQVKGPWILFSPENAGYHKNEKKTTNPADARLELPGPDGHKLVQKKPEPLLYYLDVGPMTITPLAMERMGQIFEWGVYEGSTSPHDFESSSFLDAVHIYNNKKYQKHGYIKRR